MTVSVTTDVDGVGDPVHHGSGVVPPGDGLHDARHHAERRGTAPPLGHGEEPVLRRQLAGHRVRALGDPGDPPIEIAGGQHGVFGEHGGVGAGEGAQAKVHNAGPQLFARQQFRAGFRRRASEAAL